MYTIPDPEEVMALAADIGLTLSSDEVDLYQAELAKQMVTLDEFVQARLPVDMPPMVSPSRAPGYRPSAEEDPLNAWTWRCHIEGAAEGLLAGKTVSYKDHTAVAAGEVDIFFGGDQGGSIRLPAAWSGNVGLKPTFGLISHFGVGFGSDQSIDYVGPTRTVDDCAAALQVTVGDDGFDPRQGRDVPLILDVLTTLGQGVTGLKIGILDEGFAGADPDVVDVLTAALDVLAAAGAEIVKIPARWRSSRGRPRGPGPTAHRGCPGPARACPRSGRGGRPPRSLHTQGRQVVEVGEVAQCDHPLGRGGDGGRAEEVLDAAREGRLGRGGTDGAGRRRRRGRRSRWGGRGSGGQAFGRGARPEVVAARGGVVEGAQAGRAAEGGAEGADRSVAHPSGHGGHGNPVGQVGEGQRQAAVGPPRREAHACLGGEDPTEGAGAGPQLVTPRLEAATVGWHLQQGPGPRPSPGVRR